MIGQYTGIAPVVTGPAKYLAGFGDDEASPGLLVAVLEDRR